MANMIKFDKYQAFALMELQNMSRSDLQIISSVCEKLWFTINGPSEMLFF